MWVCHVLAHVPACPAANGATVVLELARWAQSSTSLNREHRDGSASVVGTKHKIVEGGQVTRPGSTRRLDVNWTECAAER